MDPESIGISRARFYPSIGDCAGSKRSSSGLRLPSPSQPDNILANVILATFLSYTNSLELPI